MPHLLSLLLALLCWVLLDEHPEWVSTPQPVGLVALPVIAWLFALRWSLPRSRRPWEFRPSVAALLPVALSTAWLGPFGGLRIWEEWELPAIVASWIGLVPFLVMQFGFRYGEGAQAGLEPDDRMAFAWRQTLAMLAVLIPVALASQIIESGLSWLPEDEAEWTAGQEALALGLNLAVLIVAVQAFMVLVPYLVGARKGDPFWQEAAARLWRGKGPPPRILEWPTMGLIANAVAVGFGPFRKVLLSDRLLQKLNPAEVEAVLAHELAHLHRRHAVTLLLGVAGAVFLCAAILNRLLPAEEPSTLLSLLPFAGVLIFIPASRVFEMQADLDATARGPAFHSAMVGVLTLLGPHTRRLQFRHFSSPKRLQELERCAAEPAAVRAWERRAQAWKMGLWALFVAGAGSAALLGI